MEPCDGCLFPYPTSKAGCPVCTAPRDARLCLSCLYVTEDPVLHRGRCEKCTSLLPTIPFGRNPLYCAVSYHMERTEGGHTRQRYNVHVHKSTPGPSPYAFPPTNRSFIKDLYDTGRTKLRITTDQVLVTGTKFNPRETDWDMWECWRCFQFNPDAKDMCVSCNASANYAPKEAIAQAKFIEDATGQNGFYAAAANSSVPCSYRPILPTSTIADLMYRIGENIRYSQTVRHETLIPFAARAFGLPLGYSDSGRCYTSESSSSRIDVERLMSSVLGRIAQLTHCTAVSVFHLQLFTPAQWMALDLPVYVLNRMYCYLERARWKQFEVNSMLGSIWSIYGLRDDNARHLETYSTSATGHGAAPPTSLQERGLRPLSEAEAARVEPKLHPGASEPVWVDPLGYIEVVATPNGLRALSVESKTGKARAKALAEEAPKLSHAARGRLSAVLEHQPGSTEAAALKSAFLAAQEELVQTLVDDNPRMLWEEVKDLRLRDPVTMTVAPSSAAASAAGASLPEWLQESDENSEPTNNPFQVNAVGAITESTPVPDSVLRSSLALSNLLGGQSNAKIQKVLDQRCNTTTSWNTKLAHDLPLPLQALPDTCLANLIVPSTDLESATSMDSGQLDVWALIGGRADTDNSDSTRYNVGFSDGSLLQLTPLAYLGLRRGIIQLAKKWILCKETWMYILDSHKRSLAVLGNKLVHARKTQLNLQLARTMKRFEIETTLSERLHLTDLVGYTLAKKTLEPLELIVLAHKVKRLFAELNLNTIVSRSGLERKINVQLMKPTLLTTAAFPTLAFECLQSIPPEIYPSVMAGSRSDSDDAIWRPIQLRRELALSMLLPPPNGLQASAEAKTSDSAPDASQIIRLLELKPNHDHSKLMKALSGTIGVTFETLSEPAAAVYARAGFTRGVFSRLSRPAAPLALAAMVPGGLAPPYQDLDGVPQSIREFARKQDISISDAPRLAVLPRNPAIMGHCFAMTPNDALIPPSSLFGNLPKSSAIAKRASLREFEVEQSLEQACDEAIRLWDETPAAAGKTTKGQRKNARNLDDFNEFIEAPPELIREFQTLIQNYAGHAAVRVLNSAANAHGAKGLAISEDVVIESWAQLGLRLVGQPVPGTTKPIRFISSKFAEYEKDARTYLEDVCTAPGAVVLYNSTVDLKTLGAICTAAWNVFGTRAVVPYIVHRLVRIVRWRSCISDDRRRFDAILRANTLVSDRPLSGSTTLADMKRAALIALDHLLNQLQTRVRPGEVVLELNFGEAGIAPTHYSLVPFRLTAQEVFAQAELALAAELFKHAPHAVPTQALRQLATNASSADYGSPMSWVIEGQESQLSRMLRFELEMSSIKNASNVEALKEVQERYQALEKASWVLLAKHDSDPTLVSNDRLGDICQSLGIGIPHGHTLATGVTWKLGAPERPEIYTSTTRIDFQRIFPYVQHPEQNLYVDDSYLEHGILQDDAIPHTHPFMWAQILRQKRMAELGVATQLAPLDLVFPPISRAWYKTSTPSRPSDSAMTTSSRSATGQTPKTIVRMNYTSNPWPTQMTLPATELALEHFIKPPDDESIRSVYVSNQLISNPPERAFSFECLPQQDLRKLAQVANAQDTNTFVEAPRFYSRIRLRMTGVNSAYMNSLILGGFEIYGAFREPIDATTSLASSTSGLCAVDSIMDMIRKRSMGFDSKDDEQSRSTTDPSVLTLTRPSAVIDLLIRGLASIPPSQTRMYENFLRILAPKYFYSPETLPYKLSQRGLSTPTLSLDSSSALHHRFRRISRLNAKTLDDAKIIFDAAREVAEKYPDFAIQNISMESGWGAQVRDKFLREVSNAKVHRVAIVWNSYLWQRHLRLMCNIAAYRRAYYENFDEGNEHKISPTAGPSEIYRIVHQRRSNFKSNFLPISEHPDLRDILFDANCMWGWHGTSFQFQTPIAQRGFRREFTTTFAYGYGVYFAGLASYSASPGYAKVDSTGKQFMFLSHVICGDLSGAGQLTPKGHSFVSDYGTPPNVFVATMDYQAIPVFIVEFSLPR